jgi:phosphatidylserine/phosphatidylglycerophosphate/cardiolipin synthase-like enzyme
MRPRHPFFVFAAASFVSFFPPSNSPAKTLDTCFSPLGHCDQVLISWINAAVKTLDGAIYGLTDDNIARALVHAHERGVKVRVVRDRSQAGGARDVTKQLIQAGIPVRIQKGSRGGLQHNKFLIIDSTYVLTGSFNWTRNASKRNDENFVVIDDQADKFRKEFERLWSLPAQAPGRPSRKKERRRPVKRVMPEPAPVVVF